MLKLVPNDVKMVDDFFKSVSEKRDSDLYFIINANLLPRIWSIFKEQLAVMRYQI